MKSQGLSLLQSRQHVAICSSCPVLSFSSTCQHIHSPFTGLLTLPLSWHWITIKIDLLNQYYIQALTKVLCTPLWKNTKWHHPQAMHKIFNKLQLYDMSVSNHSFDTKKKALFFGMKLHLNQDFLSFQKILLHFIRVFLWLRSIKTLKGLRRKVIETRNSIDTTISPKIFSNTLYHLYGNKIWQHQLQQTSQSNQRSHIPLVTKGKS